MTYETKDIAVFSYQALKTLEKKYSRTEVIIGLMLMDKRVEIVGDKDGYFS